MSLNSSAQRKQILAVDDEQEILDIVKATLEPEGFTVVGITSPEAALKYYGERAHEIDLVLLDFLMPGMSGELVFDCMQNINADVRVVLLTGCDDRVARTMFGHGLKGFIQKPFFLDDFKAQVKQYLYPD